MRIIFADHLLPGDASAIADAAVVLDDSDRVVAVGRAAALAPAYAGLPATRIAGVVLPGLVNAHTHLELSALAGKVPGGSGFVPWVERLIAIRPEISPEGEALAIARAVRSLVEGGTVAVGEVTNSLAAAAALAQAGLAGSVFHEVFGWDRERGLARLDALAVERAERFGDGAMGALSYAPSPHTLYTTHPDVVRSAFARAEALGAVASLHLAEHSAERAAIESGGGGVPDWLARRSGLPASAIGWPNSPLFDYAAALGALRPGVLLVHLTDATAAELARVRRSGAQVVLCPSSNLHIEGRLPPLRAMLDAGLAPALGSDSLASSDCLDVLAEAARLLAAFPEVPAWEYVKMATFNGARALGLGDLGSIRAGMRPGLIAVEAPAVNHDAARWLLENVGAPRRVIAHAHSEPS
jgi:cytosine/adenosine deaminase-related metal-dependent hydrolase